MTNPYPGVPTQWPPASPPPRGSDGTRGLIALVAVLAVVFLTLTVLVGMRLRGGDGAPDSEYARWAEGRINEKDTCRMWRGEDPSVMEAAAAQGIDPRQFQIDALMDTADGVAVTAEDVVEYLDWKCGVT